MEVVWIISEKVELNIYLVFGIDYRPFLNQNDIDKRAVADALKKIDTLLKLELLYGNCVFPQCFQSVISHEKLIDMKNQFWAKDFQVKEAVKADKMVFIYLTDVLGSLVIKKRISTSIKVMCCNELGISEELFDAYVSYREIRDTDVKLYPYCD